LYGAQPWQAACPPDPCYVFVRRNGLAALLAHWAGASYEEDPAQRRYLSPEALDLIERLLTVDPSARLTLAGLKAHPWWQAHVG